MKKIFNFFCCISLLILLSGFEAGIEAEKLKNSQPKSNEPVLKYEEPKPTVKSNQDRFHEYHLLAVTSLEEASESLKENPARALSMAQNSNNYVSLIKKLLNEDNKDLFNDVINKINSFISMINKPNLSDRECKEISKNLRNYSKTLNREYDFDKVKQWIVK